MRPTLLVIAAFAIVATLLAWSRWLAGRRWAAGGHLLLGCAAGAVVAVAWPVAAYVKAFEPLLPAIPVAELSFEQTGADRYRVTLTRLPSGRMQVVDVNGHEWRLELATLEWADWTARFGPSPAYRIEGFDARRATPNDPAVPHGLLRPAGPPPWLAGLGTTRLRPLLVARQVTSEWQPMRDRASYEVRLAAPGTVEVALRSADGADRTVPSQDE